MKDMGETYYVISIQIHMSITLDFLGPSQKTYINKVLERFWMKDCSPSITLIVKGNKFNLNQCPKMNLKKNKCITFIMFQLLKS